jgi:hypothetical protein
MKKIASEGKALAILLFLYSKLNWRIIDGEFAEHESAIKPRSQQTRIGLTFWPLSAGIFIYDKFQRNGVES